MQVAAFQERGLDADYSRFHVDADDVESAVDGAEVLGIEGLNVTIPHKRSVAELDTVETRELAEMTDAVNTLDFRDGKILGFNTDGAGARRALERAGAEIEDGRVVVVGAGGASRGISFELARNGVDLKILNRTASKARELASDIRGYGFEADGAGLDVLSDAVDEADVLVNATSVGMKEDETPVPGKHLHSDLVVFDAVYTPLETRLLREAREAGAETVEGAWMLVLQGAEAFEIWTDLEAPIETMNRVLREKL